MIGNILPVWAQYTLGVAAVLGAFGAIWRMVIRPLLRLHSTIERLYPSVVALERNFGRDGETLSVLYEIAGQFRTNSGSSLRDLVDRIEQATIDNRASSELLRVGVEATRQLADLDRTRVEQMMLLLDRLTVKVDESGRTTLRMEGEQHHVAAELATALSEAQARAMAADKGEAGAAADAAVLPPKDAP